MTATRPGTTEDWTRAGRLPDRVVPSCLYDSAGWLGAWEAIGVEDRIRHDYVCTDHRGGSAVLPVYLLAGSPFWHGYLAQTGHTDLAGRHVFAGSTYSMYTKRGPFPAALARGAYATAAEWIAAGEAELLVVPNLTDDAAAVWVAEVGPPVGRVLLDRTYGRALAGDFAGYLHQLPAKIRRDVRRRLARGHERGLRVDLVPGTDAHDLVPAALPLTVGTTDEHDWPPLYDEATLHGLLRVPGAVLAAARVGDRLVGVFFGFRHGTEVTFLCGGVDYATLTELSTYVALMYRCTEWAYANGFRRIEWGRDNYRFKERHGLAGTDLWALVYAPRGRPGLAEALAAMCGSMVAYIEERR